MIVDRDGGLSPGELRGEKAVGRVEAPLIHLGPYAQLPPTGPHVGQVSLKQSL